AAGSLPRLWVRRWREDPDRIALVDLGDNGREIDAAQVLRRTERLAGLLASRGVAAGDRILFSGEPTVEYLLLYVAALRLGATVVPANTGYRERELAHIATDSGASFAVIDDETRGEWLGLPSIMPREAASAPEDDHRPPLDQAAGGDLAMVAYTSGTTGRPKGAMLTHGNLLASAVGVGHAWQWSSGDGLILALPLFHLHGLGVGVNGSFAAGARILLVGSFDAVAVTEAARRADATMFFGVPTMYQRLAALAEERPETATALASLRIMVSGSAPLPADLWRRIEELTGETILERYGMTETVMLLSNPYEGERVPGTVGFPLPGVEARLAGGGPTGEIEVRGPNVFQGYLGNEEATTTAFTEDGFFRTGDLGSVDTTGRFSIVGRLKELIISGGYNVYPREIEEVLEEHGAVRTAAVCGLPSAEWGELIAAAIVPTDPADPPSAEELSVHCAERLAGYKKPRRFVFLEALPRNAMGKISRTELAAAFD
ncbi:MAG: acyl-CoA synthetase, partial [Solirubrobacterales bacterium]